ncbi:MULTISPECIES: hypothetical protein [unclassified Rhizobium]|uniref:hypothetical protein n=1 Tax=unclassified Rhizobium TaxID=2613769 RepID=UPI000EA98059|nr:MULTISPECIES: hypothetical protein [unclassified Rhizobium]AYG68678.1 hypothetical protein CCGE531_21455 [Rhizobium sp. CCGE531]AYG75064.1 hypothetical protein CCGE532_20940 [Rhizobium sp. CCGE532]
MLTAISQSELLLKISERAERRPPVFDVARHNRKLSFIGRSVAADNRNTAQTISPFIGKT